MEALKMDTDWIAGLRDQALRELRAAMPPANLAAAMRCSTRLRATLPRPDQLASNAVMVAYGGGKDSTYALAFVRAMQLLLFRAHGTTFRLRVVTNRHAGMPRAVLENIDRAYDALRLVADPGCELLLVDASEVAPFRVDAPQREQVVQRNRLDILMTGHRTFADGRPTFCNACNLSMVNSFGLAASHGDGVDVIVTGDSQQEQRAYALWVHRLARRLDPTAKAARRNGFTGLLTSLDAIARSYFAEIHGPDAADAVATRRVATDTPAGLQFFSIFEDTDYAAGDHFELLTGHLGFRFDELAFSFTETDCANPALMAHLRGLKCERVYGRSYQDGIDEYVRFAVGLMRKKDFPPALVEQMLARYDGPAAVAKTRETANEFALSSYGLSEEQLVCMVYSPFAEKGAGLDNYLQREQPALAASCDDIRALLTDEFAADPRLATALERMSGLPIARLRVLYGSSVRGPSGASIGTGLIDTVLADDPHKGVISTQQSADGPIVLEWISGR